VKGKETARAHLIFLKGWCEIQGEEKKKKKTNVVAKFDVYQGCVPPHCIRDTQTFQTSPRKAIFSGLTTPYAPPK